MKAVGAYRPLPIDDPESLVDIDCPVPQLKPRDILVRIEAISVNPVDVKLRVSEDAVPGVPRILGYDAVGVVEAIGSEARLFKLGDAVFYAGAIDRPGANSEFHVVDERIVGPKPVTLTAAQAAALPLTALTAWELLFDRLGIPYGRKIAHDAILIVGGAGGVGSILTQLARRLTGLTVIATASRPETADWCTKMGAHHVIDHHRPLNDGLRELGISDVRYVAGLAATDTHQKAIVECLAPQGSLAMIDDPKTFDIVPFKRKCLSIHWELMFTRSLYCTRDMGEQQRILSEVSALVDSGVLRTTLREDCGAINAANLRRAHAMVESGRGIGKVVLSGF
ncbi:MAG TPA: zinc-binding alcohol dehydrogenase family protein [Bordetella sp.]|jgi:zinc-binding alcohol dehydrogenase family protein|nr:zinc-binding alcohol dehydrogenase family protein [Bordetella sp.]